MLSLERSERSESPLRCPLAYRRLGAEGLGEGTGIGWSGRTIRFSGDVPVRPGGAIEIRLEAVRGFIPALMVLAEVTQCESRPGARYELVGAIRGILAI